MLMRVVRAYHGELLLCPEQETRDDDESAHRLCLHLYRVSHSTPPKTIDKSLQMATKKIPVYIDTSMWEGGRMYFSRHTRRVRSITKYTHTISIVNKTKISENRLTEIKNQYNPPSLSKQSIGDSPSGKAADFDSAMRRFESYIPSHNQQSIKNHHLMAFLCAKLGGARSNLSKIPPRRGEKMIGQYNLHAFKGGNDLL